MRTQLLLSLTLLGLTLACREDAESPMAPDTPAALATTASALVFAQVSAGLGHSCGVTADNRAYCWGPNASGQLGDGTTDQRLVPVPVAGSLHFRQISAGDASTCGVTTDNKAYCWGYNATGQLGDGTTTSRLKPVAVVGGRLFRRVETDFGSTCAVTYSGGRAFCWGDNHKGQLGIGNNTGPESGAKSSKPVAVTGGLIFRNVTVGLWHTCGVTPENRVFCWGYNHYGELGDSSTAELRVKPTRVVSSRQYRQVDAGFFFTCAVTLAARAFCWGAGAYGQLGNGTEDENFRYPKAVSGGLSFDRVTVGAFHACAESTANRAYCWGHAGFLGDGTNNTNALTPVAVAGGLFFSQLSAGRHTCGKTAEGRAYCWGPGSNGELGNGTTAQKLTPTPVAGPT